jgi:hypothetical protein
MRWHHGCSGPILPKDEWMSGLLCFRFFSDITYRSHITYDRSNRIFNFSLFNGAFPFKPSFAKKCCAKQGSTNQIVPVDPQQVDACMGYEYIQDFSWIYPCSWNFIHMIWIRIRPRYSWGSDIGTIREYIHGYMDGFPRIRYEYFIIRGDDRSVLVMNIKPFPFFKTKREA